MCSGGMLDTRYPPYTQLIEKIGLSLGVKWKTKSFGIFPLDRMADGLSTIQIDL
jgi:hypothetical protein